jgi:hypothetical protein
MRKKRLMVIMTILVLFISIIPKNIVFGATNPPTNTHNAPYILKVYKGHVNPTYRYYWYYSDKPVYRDTSGGLSWPNGTHFQSYYSAYENGPWTCENDITIVSGGISWDNSLDYVMTSNYYIANMYNPYPVSELSFDNTTEQYQQYQIHNSTTVEVTYNYVFPYNTNGDANLTSNTYSLDNRITNTPIFKADNTLNTDGTFFTGGTVNIDSANYKVTGTLVFKFDDLDSNKFFTLYGTSCKNELVSVSAGPYNYLAPLITGNVIFDNTNYVYMHQTQTINPRFNFSLPYDYNYGLSGYSYSLDGVNYNKLFNTSTYGINIDYPAPNHFISDGSIDGYIDNNTRQIDGQVELTLNDTIPSSSFFL